MARWDFIIVGSGFGGSVSALRLVEKGYRVLLIEKGKRLGPDDFPKSNWDLKRWLWFPKLGMTGLFKMTFFKHVTALSGVGVGGGSLVYANTLPVPKDEFFEAGTWKSLAKWKSELAPHYQTVRKMLGAAKNPQVTYADEVIAEVGKDMGKTAEPTTVAVHFGVPGETVKDPYFGGEGPDRTGCTGCGGCMLGCRVGAKNTLDKNYLYFAEKKGLTIEAETEVIFVAAIPDGGYKVEVKRNLGKGPKEYIEADKVILAGGVLGTVPLLLRSQQFESGLPKLAPALGQFVRTNSESLIGVTTRRKDLDFSKGIAIGSILQTDDHSHLEPVRYPEGSGFFRMLGAPSANGATFMARMLKVAAEAARNPAAVAKAYLVKDWAKSTLILLYMRTMEGTLSMHREKSVKTGFLEVISTSVASGDAPTSDIPEAAELARKVAEKIDGQPMALLTETLGGIPTTAHILGGACIGTDESTGVTNAKHEVFNYPGLYVIDGSSVPANPGVNPSLTIAALAERAMSFIPSKARA